MGFNKGAFIKPLFWCQAGFLKFLPALHIILAGESRIKALLSPAELYFFI